MNRLTVVGVVLAAMCAAAMVGNIWYGHSLIYMAWATLVAVFTAAVWWIWVWKKMTELNDDPARQHRRFLR